MKALGRLRKELANRVVNELIQPTSAIASYANEVATESGNVVVNSKTDRFIQATEVPLYLPLSGKTMEVDGTGECIAGCQN